MELGELKMILMAEGVHPSVVNTWLKDVKFEKKGEAVMASRSEKASNAGEILLYGPIVSSIMEALVSSWLGPDLVCSANSCKRKIKAAQDAGLKNINLRINSPGGSVFDANAIYASFEAYRAEDGNTIHAYVDGMAASAASYVMLASEDVIISEVGMVFIHNSRAVLGGSAKQIMHDVQILQKIDKTITGVYARKSKSEEPELSRLMEAETWLTATEAHEMGLVDKVATHESPEGGKDEKADMTYVQEVVDVLSM